MSQVLNGVPYEFVSWNDGNTNASRTIACPEQNLTYTATYRQASNLYLSDLPTKGTPTNGKGPMELDRANGGTAKGGSLSAIKALFPSFFDRIYDAAYDAFRSGLSVALIVSAVLIVVAAALAAGAATRD